MLTKQLPRTGRSVLARRGSRPGLCPGTRRPLYCGTAQSAHMREAERHRLLPDGLDSVRLRQRM